MRVALGIDQLGVDANLLARPLDAAFEHIAHPQLAADLLRVDRFVLVGEGAIARDHETVGDPRQIGRQSSVTPSAKYCWPGSLLRLAKGSTTIDRRGATSGCAVDMAEGRPPPPRSASEKIWAPAKATRRRQRL